MSTWETSKRFPWDYAIHLIGGEYYVLDDESNIVAREGTGGTALQAAIDAAPATGAEILLHPDFDADGETVTIDKSFITVDTGLQVASDTWVTPRIQKVHIQTAGQTGIRNVAVNGLAMRHFHVDANSGSIHNVMSERCQYRPSATDSPGIHIDGAGSYYVYYVRISDGNIQDYKDQTVDAEGAIYVETPTGDSGQIFFTDMGYKTMSNNTTMFCNDGYMGPIVSFQGLHYAEVEKTGCKPYHFKANSRMYKIALTNTEYEIKSPYDIINIDDDCNALAMLISNMFIGASPGPGNTVYLIDNNAALADWVSWINNGVWGDPIYVTMLGTDGDFEVGDPAVNARFGFDANIVVRDGDVQQMYYHRDIFSGGTENDLATDETEQFFPVDYKRDATTTEAIVAQVMPCAGITHFARCHLTAAPGIGNTRVFTFMVNGAPTALTLTVAGAATTDTATTRVAWAAGDRIDWSSDGGGGTGPVASAVRAALEVSLGDMTYAP